MGFFSGIKSFFKSPTDYIPDTREVMELNQSDRERNNAHYRTPYGSQVVTYDENGIPTITREFAPEYENLRQMQVASMGNGPMQMRTSDMTSGFGDLFGQMASRTGLNVPNMSAALGDRDYGLASNQPNAMSQGIVPPSGPRYAPQDRNDRPWDRPIRYLRPSAGKQPGRTI